MDAKRTARFWAKVDVRGPDECWLWENQKSYTRFWTGDRLVYGHRLAYELLVGPIPEALELDHTCRNPRCVNPAHLEPVTHRENVMRGDVPREHCGKCGRPQTLDGRGVRICKPCRSIYMREWREAHR